MDKNTAFTNTQSSHNFDAIEIGLPPKLAIKSPIALKMLGQ